MANMEVIERLGVELSLESDSFTKKMQTVNKAIKNADKEFKEAKRGVADFENSFVGLGKTIDKNKKDIDLYNKKLEEQEKEFNDLNKKLEEHQQELKKIEEEQGKNSKAYKEQRDKVVKFADSVIKLNQDMEKTKKALDNSNKSLKENQEKYDSLGKVIKTTDDTLEEIKSTLEEAQQDFNDLTRYIDNADNVFKKIKDTTDSFRKQLDLNNQALSIYKQKIKETENVLSQNEEKHKQLNYQIKKTEAELTQAKSEYGENSTEAQQLGAKLNGLKDDYMRLGNEIEQNKQDLNKYQNEVNTTESKMKDLSTAIKKVPWKEMEEDLERVKGELEEAQGKLEGFATKVGLIGGASLAAFGEASNATSKFQGALGLTSEEAEKLTEKAQELNKKGFEFDEAQEAILQVQKVLKDTLSDDEIDKYTRQVLALAKTFDVDANDAIKATNTLVKNFGIDGEHALDLITFGMQNGLDVSGDFIDTLWEYAPQFTEMGYTADQFLKILVTGMQEGAFNTDKLADGVKEFRLRLSDVGKAQEEALGSLGLNVKEVTTAFNEGGEAGQQMAFKVAAELMKVKDETKRNQLATALFGTMYEDVGDAVIKSLAYMNDEQLEVKGTTESMTQAFEESFGAQLRGKLAELKEPMEALGKALLPCLDVVGELITKFTEWFSSLDEGTVEAIATFGILVLAITPLLKVGISATTAMQGLTKIIGGMGTPAAATSGSVGGLSKIIGMLGAYAIPLAIAALVAVIAKLGDNEQALLSMQEKWGAFGTIFSGICEFISGVWDLTIGYVLDTGMLLFDLLAAMMDGPGGQTMTEAWDRYNEKLLVRTQEGMSKVTLQSTRGMSQMLNATQEGLNNVANVFAFGFDNIDGIVGMSTDKAASTFAQKLQGMSDNELQILEGMNDQTQALFWNINESMTVKEKTAQVAANIEKMKLMGIWNVESMRDGMKNGIDTVNKQLEKGVTTGTSSVEKEIKDMATDSSKSVNNMANDTKSGMGNANNGMQQEATNIYKGVTTSFYMMEKKTKQHATDMMKGVNTSTNTMSNRSKEDGTSMYKGVSTSANNMSRNAKQAATDMMRGVTNSTSQMASRAIADWNRIRNAFSVPIRGTIQKTTINTSRMVQGQTLDLQKSSNNLVLDKVVALADNTNLSKFDVQNRYFSVTTQGSKALANTDTTKSNSNTDILLKQLINIMLSSNNNDTSDIIINNILDDKIITSTVHKKIDKKLGENKTINNRFRGGRSIAK